MREATARDGHFGTGSGSTRTATAALKTARRFPKGWLDRYDRNGDEKITKKEFAAVIRRPAATPPPAHASATSRARAKNSLVRFDQRQGREGLPRRVPGRPQRRSSKSDRNKDGNLEWRENS